MVDSCVILDVITKDPHWFEWSSSTVSHALEEEKLVVNPVVYAEVSVRYLDIREVEAALPATLFEFQPITREAAFLAGKCFARYRKRGGTRTSPLPDFFIGAHAALSGYALITRDPRRFREYFPKLEIVCP